MPTNLRSPHGDVPPMEDPAVEALLAGNLPPADAAAELRPLAEAFAALRVAPGVRELAGEPAARAAYRGGFGRVPRPARSHRRRKPRLSPVLTAAKLAVAGAVAVGALTGVAYADVLPAPVQNLAHQTLDAPAPHITTPARQPAGPGSAGTEAGGLCHAWARAEADGRPREEAVAFRNLAAAAGGAAQVTAYCATAAHRGTQPPGQNVSHPHGKPSAASPPNPAGHATGKPASHPSHPDHPSHPSHPPHPGAQSASHP
jgi:hypothetical protein